MCLLLDVVDLTGGNLMWALYAPLEDLYAPLEDSILNFVAIFTLPNGVMLLLIIIFMVLSLLIYFSRSVTHLLGISFVHPNVLWNNFILFYLLELKKKEVVPAIMYSDLVYRTYI